MKDNCNCVPGSIVQCEKCNSGISLVKTDLIQDKSEKKEWGGMHISSPMEKKEKTHPWQDFLNARKRAILWMREEKGYSDRDIVQILYMDERQLYLIRTGQMTLSEGYDPPPWNMIEHPEKTEGWIAYQEYLRKKDEMDQR